MNLHPLMESALIKNIALNAGGTNEFQSALFLMVQIQIIYFFTIKIN